MRSCCIMFAHLNSSSSSSSSTGTSVHGFKAKIMAARVAGLINSAINGVKAIPGAANKVVDAVGKTAQKQYSEIAKSTAPVARTCIAGACNEASCVCLQTSKTAWATRVNSLPIRWNHAKQELAALKAQLKAPGNLSVGEAVAIGLLGAEGVLFFCAGEVVGRGSFIGYAV